MFRQPIRSYEDFVSALLEAGFALSDFTGINIRGGAILPRTENGALVGVVISGTPGLTDYRVPYSGPASGARIAAFVLTS